MYYKILNIYFRTMTDFCIYLLKDYGMYISEDTSRVIVFSSTWFLSWLHVSSNLTWFYNLTWLLTWLTWLDESNLSFKKLYIVSNVFPSPDIKAENVLSTEKECVVVVHVFKNILLQLLNSLTIRKSEKRNH